MKIPLARCFPAGIMAAGLISASPASATNLVYSPVNPSFGGNPMNGSVLLNSANAQNHYTASAGSSLGYKAPSALDTFNQRLQSMILDRVATSITGNIFDANGHLKAGTVDTSAFTISIVDIGSGVLKITTTDKTTGASTSFEVTSAP